MSVVLDCPAIDTPDEPRSSWIVRRKGATSVPDGRGGYTDTDDDVAAYCGYLVRPTRRFFDRLQNTGQGVLDVAARVFLFDGLPGLDIRTGDKLVEATADVSHAGSVVPLTGGRTFYVYDVGSYDAETQVAATETLKP